MVVSSVSYTPCKQVLRNAKASHGRSARSLTWGGLFNTYYWIDPGKRVAAVFMTQVLPFADNRALRLYRQFEREIYALVKSA